MPPLRSLLALAGPSLLFAACLVAGDDPPPPPAEPPPELAPAPPPETVDAAIAAFVEDAAAQASLRAELDTQAQALHTELAAHGPVEPGQARALLEGKVLERLSSWHAHREAGDFPVDAERLREQAIRWEAFRLSRYVSSGVLPKTYFGFFDEAWDTAAHEATMRETVGCTSAVINGWQAERGAPLRVTDAEIAVTFIAEGGALMLTTQQAHMNDLHPVLDVGLDDLASGLGDYQGLLEALDAGCGTDLGGTVLYSEPGVRPAGAMNDRLIAPEGQWAWLARNATFREGIVGTALMWIWEKEIAQRKLAAEERTPLHQRGLDEQFIIGSLVYNSGILHSERTARTIARFQTGQRVYDDSERNAHRRPRLNLLPPAGLLGELIGDGGIRRQPTSWLAAYHVLQRYGAWEGLRRFSDVFDEQGAYRERGG